MVLNLSRDDWVSKLIQASDEHVHQPGDRKYDILYTELQVTEHSDSDARDTSVVILG